MLDVILEVPCPQGPRSDKEGFNPYCVGCNLRRVYISRSHNLNRRFNPYCVGCNLRSDLLVRALDHDPVFQSLLCWM